MGLCELVNEQGRLGNSGFMNDMNRSPTPLGPGRPPHDGFEFKHRLPRPPFHPPMGMEMGMMPGHQAPVMMVPGQPGPPFPGSPIFRPPMADGHPMPPLPPPPVPAHMVPPHMPPHHAPPLHPPHPTHPHALAPSHAIPPPHPPPPSHPPHPSLALHPQHPHMPNTLMPPGTQFPHMPPGDAKPPPPLPPDPQGPQPDLSAPPPLPSSKLTVQPPLPPLPPLPPPVDLSKPPPPKEPPPPSPVKKPPLPSSSPPAAKLPQPSGNNATSSVAHKQQKQPEEKKNVTKAPAGKPIPSIVSSQSSGKPTHQQSTNGTANPRNNALRRNHTPTPPLPPLLHSNTRQSAFSYVPNEDAQGAVMEEEPYDPEEAMFSPSSSTESSPAEESQEDSLINKYVRNPKAGTSMENFTSSLKTPERVKSDAKKKRVSFSNEVSFSSESKTPQESPARPNLDTRLKIMFGTGPSVSDPSPPKMKKPLNKLPLPLDKQEKTDRMDDLEQPLSPTPSPFISRHMYLYWHRETVKLRRASKLSNMDFVDSNAKAQLNLDGNAGKASVKTPVNGQVLTPGISPLVGIPPLPKNLPTVPPPNYKKPLSEHVTFKDNSLKAESSLKNVGRVHPYKTSHNKKSNTIKTSSMDAEFELACEAIPLDVLNEKMDSSEFKFENVSNPKDKTVNLVMKRVIDDLRKAIRYELTKELIDKKLKKCLKTK
ncbi:ras-associated and pleckstrin homology domains-containing protein 1-like [Penaeus japonicus]|uniref:ras-associated and pleckstrin homology domains-containing protein 1-like n=1 Tax=Penaeus japonicus TaxID=27405 RepID=UPI001C70C07A|nr:ras-associated and pleckstrin homology domains-containing protein 1-like [Penaeus japonicus]XP_042878716.1 ras-associated and pleckstrin homology domains-containing protein 1-like [Penaeus japonicus]